MKVDFYVYFHFLISPKLVLLFYNFLFRELMLLLSSISENAISHLCNPFDCEC